RRPRLRRRGKLLDGSGHLQQRLVFVRVGQGEALLWRGRNGRRLVVDERDALEGLALQPVEIGEEVASLGRQVGDRQLRWAEVGQLRERIRQGVEPLTRARRCWWCCRRRRCGSRWSGRRGWR